MTALYFGLHFSYSVCLPYSKCDSGTSLNHGCLRKIHNSRPISDLLNQNLQFNENPTGIFMHIRVWEHGFGWLSHSKVGCLLKVCVHFIRCESVVFFWLNARIVTDSPKVIPECLASCNVGTKGNALWAWRQTLTQLSSGPLLTQLFFLLSSNVLSLLYHLPIKI